LQKSHWEKYLGSGFLKNSTDRMLTRIKSIYLFIQEKGTVTTQELVDEFGITPRTIQRDLNVLAYNDLVESPSRGKWTTTNKKVKMTS
jgi:DeoR/GlpR family transcriptional regulator of sugar metabolism